MNTRAILLSVASLLVLGAGSSAGSELETLRARVAEQERQIQLLERENARLRDAASPRRTRSLPPEGTSLVTASHGAAPRSTPAADGYTVVPGDNLVRIGRTLGVSAEALAKANGLQPSSIIHPGQTLKIPGKPATATGKTGSEGSPTPDEPGSTHAVRAGETFYSIARQHGVQVDRLMAANPETPPASLRVGQNLRVPGRSKSAAAADAPAPDASPETQPAAQSPGNRRQVRTIMIDGDMSYGAFAAKHGTTPERLNQLNGLDLDARTVLAKGSELYVPALP